jgi:T5orf172 domain
MTSEYIKEAYQKLRSKLGKQPSSDEFYENTTVTLFHLLKNGFRTYSQLVEEMGDTPKRFSHGGKTEEHYLNSYGKMVRQLNRIPSTSDWVFHKGEPAMSNYKKKFKITSWAYVADKFIDFAKDKEEWKDVVKLIPIAKKSSPLIQERENEECYVYFMFDKKNSHYKIGISNEPEWREKTLQSEKPTIKLIAAKKFVNRRIAANIEKALHDSYSHKRKRGEWFELDKEDIEEIKITLSQ